MSRKIFISFLGTGQYVRCPYAIDGKESSIVRFVQEAYLETQCMDWDEKDQISILLTDEAYISNWKGGNYSPNAHHKEFKTNEDESLENRLKILNDKGLKPNVKAVKGIPSGKNTQEIWSIFEILVNQIKDNDHIYFDITNGFRSLPMLGMVFLNYIKTIKQDIKIKSISYGAYENLAGLHNTPIFKIKDINVDKRKAAPILDLISFSELQDWTNAANIFVKYGNSEELAKLGEKETWSLLNDNTQASYSAFDNTTFFDSLRNTTENIRTNRGIEIIRGNMFHELKNSINQIQKEDFISPMKPILKKIEKKISSFSSQEDWKNGFAAVEWCIDHNLIQQGLTMLQESLVTYYCCLANTNYNSNTKRNLIIGCFYIIKNSYYDNPSRWNREIQKRPNVKDQLIELIDERIVDIYYEITEIRNDINHAGFRQKPLSPSEIKQELQDNYNNIKSILIS